MLHKDLRKRVENADDEIPEGIGIGPDGRFGVFLDGELMAGSGSFFYADLEDEGESVIPAWPLYVRFDKFDEANWKRPHVRAGFDEAAVDLTRTAYKADDHAEFAIDEDSVANYPLDRSLPTLRVELVGFPGVSE